MPFAPGSERLASEQASTPLRKVPGAEEGPRGWELRDGRHPQSGLVNRTRSGERDRPVEEFVPRDVFTLATYFYCARWISDLGERRSHPKHQGSACQFLVRARTARLGTVAYPEIGEAWVLPRTPPRAAEAAGSTQLGVAPV